jgi:hypothetical protein
MSGDEDVHVEVAELIVFLHRGGIRGGGGCEVEDARRRRRLDGPDGARTRWIGGYEWG